MSKPIKITPANVERIFNTARDRIENNISKIKIKFPKGVVRVNVPFMMPFDITHELGRQMKRVKIPKAAKRIGAEIRILVDLEGDESYELAQVFIEK